MRAYTYIDKGTFRLTEKADPEPLDCGDAIVRVTLSSICASDLHIKHGSVPRAVKGITVGHEAVGIVEAAGACVRHVKPGDRVAVNVESFCGKCFFCKQGYVNNCEADDGGWAIGCRIDGTQAERVRVPYADSGGLYHSVGAAVGAHGYCGVEAAVGRGQNHPGIVFCNECASPL